ncbi:MAG TPA: hypothetical protein VHV30_12895 [Polyangiaceae bacterium]|nr:hypothetical protein [Polyangiaceae bacterium]
MSNNITSKINKPIRQDLLRRIARGVQMHYPSGQMTLAGQTFNMPTDLVNLIQGDISVIDVADKAHADWLAAVQAQRVQHQKVGPVLRALQRLVLAQFGDTQDAASTLADFGYAPPKVTVPTAATQAAAVEKRGATRAARHTMGKNQKKDVKGAVTTPAPSPTTPGASPAPAQGTPAAPAASAPAPAAAPRTA